jgi:molybdenum cofactor sulfurtransferase
MTLTLNNLDSQSNSSIKTTSLVNETRRRMLKTLFNTDMNTYTLIFTSGATHSCKLLSETFPFQESNAKFLYLMNNHNSVLGIREIARDAGASVHCIQYEQIQQSLNSIDTTVGNNLFAFSPECNSTGEKIRTEIIQTLKKKNMFVLMDASKYVSTNFLDLSIQENQADFIVFSAYKIFGYPMGIGALLVKNSSAYILKKKYFGGGTVSFATADIQKHQLRPSIHESFEDGTLPYLNIIALNHALKIVPKLIQQEDCDDHFLTTVQKHTFYLSQKLYDRLKTLQHYNGNSVCVFYGSHHLRDKSLQGSIVNFNLLRSDGSFVGYGEASQAASLHSPQINLRTGCFCNPGACQTSLGMSGETVIDNFDKGHTCWDGNDIINGNPTGSIRISFGWMSTESDIDHFIDFMNTYFVETKECSVTAMNTDRKRNINSNLTHVIVYPVKSCQGYSISSDWELSDSGLRYDREWTIVNHAGVALQQKLYPQMASIETSIDLKKRLLILSNSRDTSYSKLSISLDEYPDELTEEQNLNVCGVHTRGLVYNQLMISQWLSDVIGEDVRLVRKSPSNDRFMRPGLTNCQQLKLNFSNEAQFLLINRSSIDDLNRRLRIQYLSANPDERKDYSGCYYANSDWLITRFRPNLVVENSINSIAYEEDQYNIVTIDNNVTLKVNGKCNRCSMICIDPVELTKYSEPLKTLFSYRRDNKGKVLFGLLLSIQSTASNKISTGCHVKFS